MFGLNSVFDHIYVISLYSEIERQDNIQKLSQKYNFDYEIIDAVDNKDLKIEEFVNEKKLAYLNNDFYCIEKCTCKGLGHNIDIKQIACSLSHLSTWSDCIDKGYKNALIMEDDVYFDDDFLIKFKGFSETIPRKWNYINLGRNNEFKSKNKYIQKIKRGFSGTQMYGISSLAAKKAVKNFYPIRSHIDGYIDYFIIQKRWGSVGLNKCYASTENFGKNGSIDGKFETNINNYFE